MEVTVDLGNLHLVGEQIGQARSRLGCVDLLQFGPVGCLAPVVFHAGVEYIPAHAKLAALELPGAIAGGPVDVSLLALSVPLVLAVHEVVALLTGDHEVHGGFGTQQVELNGVVVDDLDVFEQLVRCLAKESTEQSGVSGDGLFADDQGSGMGNVVGGELAPVFVEGDTFAEAENPLRAVGLGDFPFGRETRLQ